MSAGYSDHTRPYTIGVSIAAFLIFLIAIFHVGKFIFKKIKKCLNSSNQEEVTEIPVKRNDDRKLSLACIQQLEMTLRYEDEVSGVREIYKRPFMRSLSEAARTKKLERSLKTRHSIANNKYRQPSFTEQFDTPKITFLAGYSHRHINDL